MIKFFRRIRQKLIEQGNLKKYFFYAIGEILLVVLGILIALQINTWNDQKKDRKLETQYFERFKKEFEENIKNVDDQIKFSEWQMRNYEILTTALKNGPMEKDSQDLFIAIEHLGRTYPIEYSNNVWPELLQNGKISIIRNQEFKEKVTSLNSDLAQTIYAQDDYPIIQN